MKRTIANELPPLLSEHALKPIKPAPARLVRSNGRFAIVKDPYTDEQDRPVMDIVCLLEHKVSTVRLKANNCGIYFQKIRLVYLSEFDRAVYYSPASYVEAFNVETVEADLNEMLAVFYVVGEGFNIKGVTFPIYEGDGSDEGGITEGLTLKAQLEAPLTTSVVMYHITPQQSTNRHKLTLELRYSIRTRSYSLCYLNAEGVASALSLTLHADSDLSSVRNFMAMALTHFDDVLAKTILNPAAISDTAKEHAA